MEIQAKRSWLQAGKQMIAKVGIVAVMILFWGLLLGWPLYNWLAV